MKKLFLYLVALWDLLRAMPTPLKMQADLEAARYECEGRRLNMARAWDRVRAVEAQRDEYERELRLLQMEEQQQSEARMQIRVHGMSRNGVIGYGVTAFIPEDVLTKVRDFKEEHIQLFVDVVARNLVDRAIRGLWYRTPLNNVAAMIFDPKQPSMLHAVAMIDGNGAPRIVTKGKKVAPEPRELPPTEDKIWRQLTS